ncbi:methyltransferase domain-containing protein [Nocardia sp. 004]|uniref:methyltransferase domain-containing protein n=1 Tax=Nocardia sp. 004 TaxID=3385978 RepID=UPI0039A02ACB
MDTAHADLTAELIGLLDLQAATPGIQRIRRWGHEALNVGPGERALDVGSGTGTEVLEFAERVGPAGEATGIDPNPAMLDTAETRADAAGANARFIEGSAYHLPFPDDYFDAVRCERVYQHLDDPTAATAEIVRVLQPGGRALLIDTDWPTMITHPGNPEVVARLNAAILAPTPNPTSGRRLRGLLCATGCTIDDIRAETVIWNPENIRPLLSQMTDIALADGAITRQELLDLTADLEAGIATGDYHFSVTLFAVLGHRTR